MTLIVQKYGGTSVADTNSFKLVAERIIECKEDNNDVVVVPSAMGSSTDELIHLASQLSEKPTPREMTCCYQPVRESPCRYYLCI